MSARRTSTAAAQKSRTGRCLRIIEKLCAHALDGMSNKELSEALNTSPVYICRDVDLLADLGWAEKLENGRYAVTARPLGVMRLYQLHIDGVSERAREFDNRISVRASRTFYERRE